MLLAIGAITYVCFVEFDIISELLPKLRSGPTPSGGLTIIDFVTLLLPILIVVLIFAGIRLYGGRFVAIGPQGIVSCHRRKGVSEKYTWDKVGRAKLDMNDVRLEINDLSIPILLLRTGTTEAGNCVNYINNFERPDESR